MGVERWFCCRIPSQQPRKKTSVLIRRRLTFLCNRFKTTLKRTTIIHLIYSWESPHPSSPAQDRNASISVRQTAQSSIRTIRCKMHFIYFYLNYKSVVGSVTVRLNEEFYFLPSVQMDKSSLVSVGKMEGERISRKDMRAAFKYSTQKGLNQMPHRTV